MPNELIDDDADVLAMHDHPGRALDLRWSHGRNVVFLTRRGASVDGVDFLWALLARKP